MSAAASLVELERPVVIPVVGDCQRVHAKFIGPADHAFDRAGAVEQALVAVTMQMNKRRRGHGSLRHG